MVRHEIVFALLVNPCVLRIGPFVLEQKSLLKLLLGASLTPIVTNLAAYLFAHVHK